MYQLILFFHVLICVALVVLVLLQHGKGADMGASFGSGASNTVFGSQGSGSFLMKVTGFLAAAFFAGCLILGGMASHSYRKVKVVKVPASAPVKAPVSDSEPAKQPSSKPAN